MYLFTLGDDICVNYTVMMMVNTTCSAAITSPNGELLAREYVCKGYDVYLSCIEESVKQMGKFCDKKSLLKWMPMYTMMKYNVSNVDQCNGKCKTTVHDGLAYKWEILCWNYNYKPVFLYFFFNL